MPIRKKLRLSIVNETRIFSINQLCAGFHKCFRIDSKKHNDIIHYDNFFSIQILNLIQNVLIFLLIVVVAGLYNFVKGVTMRIQHSFWGWGCLFLGFLFLFLLCLFICFCQKSSKQNTLMPANVSFSPCIRRHPDRCILSAIFHSAKKCFYVLKRSYSFLFQIIY